MFEIRYLLKGELEEANRQALKGGGRAIEPSYVQKLPADCRYPILREIPWERHGWVRCEIGTASAANGEDYRAVWLDVPQRIHSNLSTMEVPCPVNE